MKLDEVVGVQVKTSSSAERPLFMLFGVFSCGASSLH